MLPCRCRGWRGVSSGLSLYRVPVESRRVRLGSGQAGQAGIVGPLVAGSGLLQCLFGTWAPEVDATLAVQDDHAAGQARQRVRFDLEVVTARLFIDESTALDLNELETLTNVVISYPPCNGYGFEEGDDVLILFEGHDRTKPKVVGFRRAPRDCNGRGIGCSFKTEAQGK